MLQPFIIFVHKVIIWHKKTIRDVFLEAKYRIVYNNAIFDVSVALFACKIFKIFYFVAFIICWTLFSAKNVTKVMLWMSDTQSLHKFFDNSVSVELGSVVEQNQLKVHGSFIEKI